MFGLILAACVTCSSNCPCGCQSERLTQQVEVTRTYKTYRIVETPVVVKKTIIVQQPTFAVFDCPSGLCPSNRIETKVKIRHNGRTYRRKTINHY